MLRRNFVFLSVTWKALSKTAHYDVCVIGGGPAGVAAALRAVDYKKKVCLIENKRIGGGDLWDGALQSKTMWEFSNFLNKTKGSPAKRVYGESLETCIELDEEAMRASIREVSETREKQITAALQATEVDVLYGQANFLSNNEIQLNRRDVKEYQPLTADYFIIATGSSPRLHPYIPIDGKLVVTSDQIMHLPLPKSLVVVGAGVIGCEFASIYAGLGKTRVSLVDKTPHILPREDRDVVRIVEQQMAKAGVHIHHGSQLYDMQPWAETAEEARDHPEDPAPRSGVQYTVMDRATKKLSTYQVERALISIGRVPNYTGLGLENTTLKTSDDRLVVDQFCKCDGVDHIYAIGDAATTMQLVAVGESQAKAAVDHIYGMRKPAVIRYEDATSSVGFLTSAVAAVGLNETECRRRNIGYIAASYGLELVSRAVAADNTVGFLKIIVSNDPTRTILGVRAVGLNASTLVDLGTLAIQRNQTALDLANRLTAYPSVSQGFQECLRCILGNSELKPGSFDSIVMTEWSPECFQRGVAYQKQLKKAAGQTK